MMLMMMAVVGWRLEPMAGFWWRWWLSAGRPSTLYSSVCICTVCFGLFMNCVHAFVRAMLVLFRSMKLIFLFFLNADCVFVCVCCVYTDTLWYCVLPVCLSNCLPVVRQVVASSNKQQQQHNVSAGTKHTHETRLPYEISAAGCSSSPLRAGVHFTVCVWFGFSSNFII